MDSLVYENANDVITQMNTGDREKDLEMVNAVLSGSIQIRPQEEEVKEEEIITTDEPVEDNIETQASSIKKLNVKENFEKT